MKKIMIVVMILLSQMLGVYCESITIPTYQRYWKGTLEKEEVVYQGNITIVNMKNAYCISVRIHDTFKIFVARHVYYAVDYPKLDFTKNCMAEDCDIFFAECDKDIVNFEGKMYRYINKKRIIVCNEKDEIRYVAYNVYDDWNLE